MDDPLSYAESSSDTGSTPRWVKVFGIIFIVLVLLFAILHLSGGGFGGHTPSGGFEGNMP